jgi:hypothetical protein
MHDVLTEVKSILEGLKLIVASSQRSQLQTER